MTYLAQAWSLVPPLPGSHATSVQGRGRSKEDENMSVLSEEHGCQGCEFWRKMEGGGVGEESEGTCTCREKTRTMYMYIDSEKLVIISEDQTVPCQE